MLRYAVIGVGLNLNHAAFPSELSGLATSLRLELGGDAVPREPLLAALLRALDGEIRLLVRQDGDVLNGAGVLERFGSASTWCGASGCGWVRVMDILASPRGWALTAFF